MDELRRLVLASPGRRRLRKSTLVGTYQWLEKVSEEALGDVGRMYARAYGEGGGVEEDGCAGEVVTPRFGKMEGVVEASEDSPRMVVEALGEGGFPRWMREDRGEELGEMDAIEAWYRQVQTVDVVSSPRSFEGSRDEPVSPLADTAITPRATPVSTPMMTRFPEKAGLPLGEPVSPLAETAITPRATPVSTPMTARFPAEMGEVVEARELSTTPKPTPKPVQDLDGAERVASWFMRTTPKPTPSPPQEVKTVDARRFSTTPKPTPIPFNTVDVHQAATEEPRQLNTTPKPPPLIIPKPIRATIQQARTVTDPYATKSEEQQERSTTPTATTTPLPSTPQQQPLAITTIPTQKPPTSTPLSATSLPPTPLSYHTTTPKLSPPPHPRNRSPLVGRERSPVLRVQTNFDAPSPRGSPQPVSAAASVSSRGTAEPDTPLPQLGLLLPLPLTPEEDLTARPRTEQPTWWDGGGMNLSIEEVMRSPVTAVEMMGGMGGLFSKINDGNNNNNNNNSAALPLTPLPFASPITPLSAIPPHLGSKQAYGPLTPLSGMARFEVNTPRYQQQQPVTPRYHHGGLWQGGGGGGGWLSPQQQQPTSALWNGPMTPNGYDDISPITRGEWGFLMGGGASGVGRQAGVGRVDVEGEGEGMDVDER